MGEGIREPLFFGPIPVERIWGGNRLGKLFGKPLPAGKTIGESWELSDREAAQSVIGGGRFNGIGLAGSANVSGKRQRGAKCQRPEEADGQVHKAGVDDLNLIRDAVYHCAAGKRRLPSRFKIPPGALFNRACGELAAGVGTCQEVEKTHCIPRNEI